MEVVEANLFDDSTAEEVPDCSEKRGKLMATVNTTPDGQWVDRKVEERCNNQKV